MDRPDMPNDVTPDMMIPDLFGRYPQARAVFDRYGLRGCGGQSGPVESIHFFARTHGVPEDQLLAEINQAIRATPPQAGEVQAPPAVADTIYRRYFIAGIVAVLTVGATWGAWLLWRIGFAGKFTAVSILDVNAHGHAQIFGWVGLFIMGFAYQAFPRMWHTDLVRPRLAVAAFVMMIVGLAASTIGMVLTRHWTAALALAMAGGGIEIVAVALFAGQLLATFRRSQAKVEPYVGFVVAALGWFVIQTVFGVWHTWNTMTATSKEELLHYVAVYQAPLRDLQIHGLALFMILGVSIRMLPALFELPAVPDRRAWQSLGLLTAGVLGESLLFMAYWWTGRRELAGLLVLSWVALAAGVVMLAWPWKLWRPMPIADRSGKFVRAAYSWLAVSLAMLLLLPVYMLAYHAASGSYFSHAYYGAIRHAITVGFVSLMIMGMAAKVVPTLNGRDPRGLTQLWGPFILVNLGCFLRVTTQTLTDWRPGLFAVVGASGVLEVAGLAWWGIGLIRIMLRGKREPASPAPAIPAPARIEPHHRVADVIRWFPGTEPVFVEHGFGAIRNPVLRRTVARQITLAQACSLRSVPAQSFLAALNQAAGL